MTDMCSSTAPNGDHCDYGADHVGPHVHLAAAYSHVWGVGR